MRIVFSLSLQSIPLDAIYYFWTIHKRGNERNETNETKIDSNYSNFVMSELNERCVFLCVACYAETIMKMCNIHNTKFG